MQLHWSKLLELYENRHQYFLFIVDNCQQMTTPGIKLLKRPSIILFCGRPASGKTTAMVSVIRQIVEFKKPAFGRFYVSTKFSGDFTFAPDEDIFENYTQEHLEAYVNKIKAWKKRNPKRCS